MLKWHNLYLFRRSGFMGLFEKDAKTTKSVVSTTELKQLLSHIIDTSVCFRFRPVGGMWIKNLMKVTAIRENSVVFFDECESKYHLVGLNEIMQFEIDERFQTYQPYYHYDVQPSSELT